MIKKNIYCKDCQKTSTLFINRDDILKCECGSENLKTIYSVSKLIKEGNLDNNIGEMSLDYIEENKFILNEMKKEKMEWNS